MNELFYSALKRGYRMNKPTHACDQVYAKTLSLARYAYDIWIKMLPFFIFFIFVHYTFLFTCNNIFGKKCKCSVCVLVTKKYTQGIEVFTNKEYSFVKSVHNIEQ